MIQVSHHSKNWSEPSIQLSVQRLAKTPDPGWDSAETKSGLGSD